MDYTECGESQTLRWSAWKGMRSGQPEVTLSIKEEDYRSKEMLNFMGSPFGKIEQVIESKIGPKLDKFENKVDERKIEFQQYIGRTVENKMVEKMCVAVVERAANKFKDTIIGLFYEE